MAENEENQKQPIATSHQEVNIQTVIIRKTHKRHKQPNRDYQDTEKPIKSRNYGKKKAIRKRNYWKRG